MHKYIGLVLVSFAMVSLGQPASAAETNLGKHSQDEIKNACNAAGGELLGVSDSGSYGCENHSTGGMILCNKNQECTGYTAARTKPDIRKSAMGLRLRPARSTK